MASQATGQHLSSPSVSVAHVMSQAHSENFPVASRLLPQSLRSHLLAIYGFARLVDDIGDEASGDRLAQLQWVESELERAIQLQATHPLFVTLSRTIAQFELPAQPFCDLIAANRQDQFVHRYDTFEDLLAYCMLSAAPVGRLVLMLLGRATPERIAWSDHVCIGLQVVEHLQDVAEDAGSGRLYLPLEDLERFGCPPDQVLTDQHRPALRATVAHEVARARALLGDGPRLAATLPLRARAAVAGFSAGGMAALDAIERAGFDVVATRCSPRPTRFAWAWLSAMASRHAGGSAS